MEASSLGSAEVSGLLRWVDEHQVGHGPGPHRSPHRSICSVHQCMDSEVRKRRERTRSRLRNLDEVGFWLPSDFLVVLAGRPVDTLAEPSGEYWGSDPGSERSVRENRIKGVSDVG